MRKLLLAAALAVAAFPALAQQTPPTPGSRMQLGTVESRRVVGIMVHGGGEIDVIYDMGPGMSVQTARVVRLENVNGMLEVVYDQMRTMPARTGGTARIVGNSGGMIEIEYR